VNDPAPAAGAARARRERRSRCRVGASRSTRVIVTSRPASCEAIVRFETLASMPAVRSAVAIAACARPAIVAGDA